MTDSDSEPSSEEDDDGYWTPPPYTRDLSIPPGRPTRNTRNPHGNPRVTVYTDSIPALHQAKQAPCFTKHLNTTPRDQLIKPKAESAWKNGPPQFPYEDPAPKIQQLSQSLWATDLGLSTTDGIISTKSTLSPCIPRTHSRDWKTSMIPLLTMMRKSIYRTEANYCSNS